MTRSKKKYVPSPLPKQRVHPAAEIDPPAAVPDEAPDEATLEAPVKAPMNVPVKAPVKVPTQRMPVAEHAEAAAPERTAPLFVRRPNLTVLIVVGLLAAGAAAVGVRAVVSDDGSGSRPRTGSVPFAAPAALKPDGTYVRTRVLASGDLRVTQWIRSTALVFEITLRTPDVAGLAPRSLRATGLRVAADGHQVGGAGAVGSAPVKFHFLGAKAVYVSYVLHGALERSGSEPGRALARVTSLDLDYKGQPTRTTRVVAGAHTLSLACSAPRPTALPRPCGAPNGDTWTVTLPAASHADRVMAQLDLGAR